MAKWLRMLTVDYKPKTHWYVDTQIPTFIIKISRLPHMARGFTWFPDSYTWPEVSPVGYL